MPDTSPRPPLSVHEAAVERYYARNPLTGELVPDPVLDAAVAAMRTARLSAEQMRATHTAVRGDQTRSQEARTLDLARALPAIAERGTTALDGASARLSLAVAETERSMQPAEPAGAEAIGLAAELRRSLQGMPETQRRKVVDDAIAAGDEVTVGALLRGPAFLSGLSHLEHERLRARWAETRHPEAYARAERLRQARDALAVGGRAMVSFAREMTAPKIAAALEAAAQAATAALHAAGREARE